MVTFLCSDAWIFIARKRKVQLFLFWTTNLSGNKTFYFKQIANITARMRYLFVFILVFRYRKNVSLLQEESINSFQFCLKNLCLQIQPTHYIYIFLERNSSSVIADYDVTYRIKPHLLGLDGS